MKLGSARPAALLFASLFVVGSVNAQDRFGLDLSWKAPAECPQQRAVRERIRALAGPSTRRARAAPPPQVEGEVIQVGSRFRLRLLVRDGNVSGERSIESDSCTDLVGAAAIAIALLMRPDKPADAAEAEPGAAASPADPSSGDASERGSEPSRASSTASDVTAAAKDPAAEATPAQDADERAAEATVSTPDTQRGEGQRDAGAARGWRVLLDAPAISSELGVVPKPSFGVGAAAGFSYERWRIRLGGETLLSQTVQAGESAYAADLRRIRGSFTGCRGFAPSRFEVSPCFSVAVEHLRVRGAGPHVQSRDATATWVSLGPGVSGRWNALASLSFVLDLGLRIETARPRLGIEGFGNVRQLGPLALAVALGPEWIF